MLKTLQEVFTVTRKPKSTISVKIRINYVQFQLNWFINNK